ncbi:MAG: hypothetical protein GY841_12335 [FCB group bacterium]|nr:hypothetical protein [FCB group bacterium]
MNKDLVKKQFGTVAELFEGQYIQEQLSRAIPSMMNVDQLIRVSLTVIRQNEKLLQCSQQSLMSCVMGCAMLGLSPEPYLGQAYFVPFWSAKLRGFESTFIPGYRGYITLARRSGELASLSAQVVYSNDDFTVRWGLDETLNHVPAEGDRGDVKGAWTVFHYNQGAPTFEYMTVNDIDKIRDGSKSKTKDGRVIGPWKDHYSEMAKKTVIRRHMKLAPLSVEDNRLMKAAHVENLAISGEQSGFFLPDTEPTVEIETEPQTETISNAEQLEFEKLCGEDLTSRAMAEWLNICAEGNGFTVEKVKAEAVKNWDNFKAGYDNWKVKKAKPINHDDETAFLNEWFRLRSGFKEYVAENMSRFNAAGPMLQQKAKEKYERLTHEKWPGTEQSDGEVSEKLAELRLKHPEIYRKLTGSLDYSPADEAEAIDLIDKINVIIDSEQA